MKTPLWEASPGALVTLINSGVFAQAHLYTIRLFGSLGVLRFTDADRDIAYGGNVWSCRGIHIDQKNSKATGHWKRGLDVDNWVIVIAPRNVDPVTGAAFPDKIGSTPWIAAARGGALDGADVQVDRAFLASWPQPYTTVTVPVGVLTIFAGRPAEVDTTDTLVVVTLNDYRELLLQKMPRNVYQAGCRHTLYDVGCTLNAAAFAVSGSVGSGSTQAVINTAAPVTSAGSGTFALGKMVMASGFNAGFSRTISQWSAPSLISLLNPFPFVVAPGDTFTVYPGCDRSLTTCGAFSNLPNFGGEPFTPDSSTAI
jgi:uncharacterized phage protein (TIGR02218 family)